MAGIVTNMHTRNGEIVSFDGISGRIKSQGQIFYVSIQSIRRKHRRHMVKGIGVTFTVTKKFALQSVDVKAIQGLPRAIDVFVSSSTNYTSDDKKVEKCAAVRENAEERGQWGKTRENLIDDLVKKASKQCSALPQYTVEPSSLIEAVRCESFYHCYNFLVSGADVDQKDMHGSTPLAFAVRRGHEFIVELLLLFGADPRIANNKGISPISIAIDDARLARFRHRLQKAKGKQRSQNLKIERYKTIEYNVNIATGEQDVCAIHTKLSTSNKNNQSIEAAAFYQENTDDLDGSKFGGQSWREHGAFGSYPGFDDYGDESAP